MPLPNYGVAIGTFVQFQRDPQDAFGHWYHGHLTIATAAGNYASALDVDTPSGVGVSYATFAHILPQYLSAVTALSNDWHHLAPTDASGALDYYRKSPFKPRPWRPIRRKFGPKHPGKPSPRVKHRLMAMPTRMLAFLRRSPWQASTGDNALSALEAVFPGSKRIFIFGEHYEDGTNGVHDIHQNQGDPANSQWYASNGIWQDGGVIVERADGSFWAWLVRFHSQATHTDAQGHPAP